MDVREEPTAIPEAPGTRGGPAAVLRNRHLWYIVALLIALAVVHYLGAIVSLAGRETPGWYLFLRGHDLYPILFAIPQLYAAYVFRVPGLVAATVVVVLVLVPDAVLLAPSPDRFMRSAMFATFVAVVGFLVAYVQDRREQAQQSERRYRLLADNVTDVIWTLDMDLNTTYVSPSVVRARGYTVEEAMGQSLKKVLTPESFRLARRVLGEEAAARNREHEGLPGGRTLQLEQRRMDGSTCWTEMTVSFLCDSQGRRAGILGVSRDISERKRAEQQLRTAETAIRTCVSAIGTTDPQGRMSYANPVFLGLWGYDSADELLGSEFASLFKDEARARALIRALLEERGVETAELLGVRKNGVEFMVGLRASVITDADGRVIGATVSLADISGRSEAGAG